MCEGAHISGAAAMTGSSTRDGALGASAMIAAPLVLLAAAAINQEHGATAASWFAAAESGPGRFYAAHLLLLLAVVLLVPAVLGLAGLLKEQRPRIAALGSGLTVLGLLGLAVMVGMDLVVWQAARSSLASQEAVALLARVQSSPGVTVPVGMLLAGLGVGPALLGLALYRQRLVSRWRAWLIPVGLTGGTLGFPFAPFRVALASCLVVSVGGLGLRLLGAARPVP